MEVPDLGPYAREAWPAPEKGKAAMISRMDADVGRLMAKLRELGIDEKTVVFFTSDNGPHKEGGVDPSFFHSSGPLQGAKRSLHDGGIREPMMVRWPGKIAPGRMSDLPWAFWDVLPTLAELAGPRPRSPRESTASRSCRRSWTMACRNVTSFCTGSSTRGRRSRRCGWGIGKPFASVPGLRWNCTICAAILPSGPTWRPASRNRGTNRGLSQIGPQQIGKVADPLNLRSAENLAHYHRVDDVLRRAQQFGQPGTRHRQGIQGRPREELGPGRFGFDDFHGLGRSPGRKARRPTLPLRTWAACRVNA